MDKNYYIDKETYEIYEEAPYTFNCDKKIAYAVSAMNKKGYKTKAACSGHYKVEFQEELNVDKSFLSECQQNPRCIIKEVRETNFDVWTEIDYTILYVLFKERYDFLALPENFTLDAYNEVFPNTRIQAFISYYDEKGKRKSKEEIELEIDKNCERLNEWAKRLPLNKERMI